MPWFIKLVHSNTQVSFNVFRMVCYARINTNFLTKYNDFTKLSALCFSGHFSQCYKYVIILYGYLPWNWFLLTSEKNHPESLVLIGWRYTSFIYRQDSWTRNPWNMYQRDTDSKFHNQTRTLRVFILHNTRLPIFLSFPLSVSSLLRILINDLC